MRDTVLLIGAAAAFLFVSSFTDFFVGAALIVAVGFCVWVYLTRVPPKSDNPKIQRILEKLSKLNSDYGNIPMISGDSAYTESKRYIVLCLKDPKTGQEYSDNTLMYVALHELSHMITPYEYDDRGNSNEHGPQFTKNFNSLLKKAWSAGIYNPHETLPAEYCGVKNEA